jgi:DNA-binding NarL/FixJ family response regulator
MLRALLVEDSISFRTVIKNELLFQFPSMEITEAGSGEEGLEKLGSHPVDLVFMDIGLPGQSGLKATKRIKADNPDVPIIILTTYDLPEFKEAAIRCGASGFVSKLSFKMDEIFALINCFQNAKQNGRKPNCIRLAGGFE